MNYGLDLEREYREQSHEDLVLGAVASPCIADGMTEVEKYLPAGERQNIGEEKMDCSPRSVNNQIETKLNYAIYNGLLSEETCKWLNEKGYVDYNDFRGFERGFELSDAYVAIKSGVTRQGTSLKAPAHSAYKFGVIPKSMLPQIDSFNEYHNPLRITQEMEDLGKEFLKRIKINYYKVYPKDYNKVITHNGGFAWGPIKDGVYQRAEYQPNHAFMRYPTDKAFDNYIDSVDGDFKKDLATDYKLLPYGYKITLNERSNRVTIKESYKKDYARFLRILKAFFQTKCQTFTKSQSHI